MDEGGWNHHGHVLATVIILLVIQETSREAVVLRPTHVRAVFEGDAIRLWHVCASVVDEAGVERVGCGVRVVLKLDVP